MAHISEEDRAELVAYLDGELDEQSSQAFEARLTRDPPLRGSRGPQENLGAARLFAAGRAVDQLHQPHHGAAIRAQHR